MVDPMKVQSTPNHGGMLKTAQGENCCTNEKLRKKKRNVSCEVNCDRESTSLTECTYTQLFVKIKKLEQLQQKILQQIKKRSHHHMNKHDNTRRECSRKSNKAWRRSISPDTSSHPRQVKTGKLNSKINSNNEIISKPVNSKYFKNLSNKMKNSILDNRINYDTLHQQDQKNLVAKNAKKHRVR